MPLTFVLSEAVKKVVVVFEKLFKMASHSADNASCSYKSHRGSNTGSDRGSNTGSDKGSNTESEKMVHAKVSVKTHSGSSTIRKGEEVGSWEVHNYTKSGVGNDTEAMES